METTIIKLARFATNLDCSELPESVVEKAKILVLDSLGCTIGGWFLPPGRIMLDWIREVGGTGQIRIAGTSVKTSMPWAIYANSYSSNLLDYDDVHPVAGHPGCTVVPPSLALIQGKGCSGKELLTAVVVAYEVGMRIGHAIKPTPERAERVVGFATWQIFCSALVASRLMALDEIRTAHALALAATNAVVPFVRKSGRHERPYAWVKNNYGWTALGGYLAASQAACGVRGNLTILDGPRGFWIMAGSDRCDFETFIANLGETYQMLNVALKPYPACRHIHTALDALDEILRSHDLIGEDVARVEVTGPPALQRDFMILEPVDAIDAQFSLPVMMAMVLLRVPPGYGWLDEEAIRSDPVRRQTEKVVATTIDPSAAVLTADWPASVQVKTTTGERFECRSTIARGHPERPMSVDEIVSKFLGLVEPTIGAGRARELAERILALERESDLHWLVEMTATR